MTVHLVLGQQDCLHFPIETIVAKALQAGVTHVQLREKQASTRDFFALGQSLQKIVKTHAVPLIINDRLDLALALEADGLHLGQSDMPYPEARRLLGPHKIIGLTIENLNHMQEANQWDLNYVGVGPIFLTPTKPDASRALGISGLRSICAISKHPVIAIGGIHTHNAAHMIKAGAQGIAVVSAITHSRDPEKTMRDLKCLTAAH